MGITVSAALRKGAGVIVGSLAASSGQGCASPGHRRTPRFARVSAAMATCACVSAIVVFGAATAGSASPPSDTIATIAGTDYPGPSAGPWSRSLLKRWQPPRAISDVSDSQLSVVRKITSAGAETVIVGNGTYGYSGDGGPATSAASTIPKAWPSTARATS